MTVNYQYSILQKKLEKKTRTHAIIQYNVVTARAWINAVFVTKNLEV